MALTKIKTGGIADDAITAGKIASGAVVADITSGSVTAAHLAGSIPLSKTNLTAGNGISIATDTVSVSSTLGHVTSVGTLGALNVTGAQSGDFLAKLTSSNAYGLYVKTVGTTTSHDLLKLNDNTGTVFKVMATGETTIGGDIKTTNHEVVHETGFGYDASGYKVIQFGGDKGGNKTISLGYDPSGNSNGSFSGNGDELLIRNPCTLKQPNDADNGWHTALGIDSGELTTYGKFTVNNDAAEHLTLKRNNSHFWDIQVGSNGALAFQKNAATDNLILAADGTATFGGSTYINGNLWVNTGTDHRFRSNSNTHLMIQAQTSGSGRLYLDSWDSSGEYSEIHFRTHDDSSFDDNTTFTQRARIDCTWANYLRFWTGTSVRMQIYDNGLVGIGCTPSVYALKVDGIGNSGIFAGGVMSAASFDDRTPYPETLDIAQKVLKSHKKLSDYDADDQEKQLDHSKLHEYVKTEHGRNVSAVVSCLVETVNDLMDKVTALENA